jgi:hypothetical protein
MQRRTFCAGQAHLTSAPDDTPSPNCRDPSFLHLFKESGGGVRNGHGQVVFLFERDRRKDLHGLLRKLIELLGLQKATGNLKNTIKGLT